MILANRKYVDPTAVLKSVTDDYGNPVLIGEQRDIGDFNLNFLERIEEGLGERKPEHSDSLIIDGMSDTGKNRAILAADQSPIIDDNFSGKVVKNSLEEEKDEI